MRKVFENNISFDDYKKCLLDGVPQMREMNLIRNKRPRGLNADAFFLSLQ